MRVEPEVVSDVQEKHRAAYDEVVRQMIEDADIVLAASSEDRKYMEDLGLSFQSLEADRRELEKQRIGSAPPDPILVRAAARRFAGIKPIEPKPYPGQSPGLARVYVAALRCRNTLFDETIKEVRRESR
jgi:hypothetical protein